MKKEISEALEEGVLTEEELESLVAFFEVLIEIDIDLRCRKNTSSK